MLSNILVFVSLYSLKFTKDPKEPLNYLYGICLPRFTAQMKLRDYPKVSVCEEHVRHTLGELRSMVASWLGFWAFIAVAWFNPLVSELRRCKWVVLDKP